jgi:hypothetical protein
LRPTFISSCEFTKVCGKYGSADGPLRNPSYIRNDSMREASVTQMDLDSRLMDTT